MSSKTLKARIISRHDITARWNAAAGFIPKEGEIIVYTDHKSKIVNGETVLIPGIKIGSGNAYVQDLAFIDDAQTEALMAHMNDTEVHVNVADRTFWNNKLNVDDEEETEGETLIFNRN